MIRSDEQWLAIIDAFHSAAIGAQSWEAALRGFADATGSRSAQLTGVNQDGSVLFNVLTNIDPPAFHSMFAETAAINPRVEAAGAAPVLKVMTEADFITPEQCRRDRFYQELARPLDIPFMCFTTLERRDKAFIALGAIRSAREEHITGEQREIFAALAPHVRVAIRTRLALEGQGAAVLTAAMDALSIPVFVCDCTGRVGALTQAAESLVTTGRGLELKAGRLRACWPDEEKALGDAIRATIIWRADGPGPAVLRTVIVRGRDHHHTAPLVLDVLPLPCQPYQFAFAPRVLVVARGPRGSKARRAAILRATYSLTSTETQIADHLAEGNSTELIAAKRGVAVETVRTQIKAIMAKLGVSRQVELVVRLGELQNSLNALDLSSWLIERVWEVRRRDEMVVFVIYFS
jgi:DNA-binding CsgD family transcriptional regulator